MGLLDNIFGSGSSADSSAEAVPGGNISKSLMIALLALCSTAQAVTTAGAVFLFRT